MFEEKGAELEATLKNTERLLHRSQSHPTAEFSRREDFLLGEIDLISRQLQGMYPFGGCRPCWLSFSF